MTRSMINPANFIMATGSDDQPTAARASMRDGVPLVANVVQLAVMLYVLHKFGALAFAAGESIRSMMFAAPFTLDLSAWYAPRAFVVLLVVGTLVAYGFHTSLAGKPLFSEPMPAQQPAP